MSCVRFSVALPVPHGAAETAARRDQRQRGSALIVAVWLVMILALIAHLGLKQSASEYVMARQEVRRAQAMIAADGAVHIVLQRMFDPAQAQYAPIDGSPIEVRVGEFNVVVAVQDERGKVDLNVSDRNLLERLMTLITSDRSAADRILAALEDWRDPDDLRRFGGAERDDYAAVGSTVQPRNGWLRSIDELRLVMHMRDEWFEALADLVTVHGHAERPDARTAPELVLLAMVDGDRAAVRTMLTDRGDRPLTAGDLPELSGRAFTVQTQALLAERGRLRRSAIVRFTGDPTQPFVIHAWQ